MQKQQRAKAGMNPPMPNKEKSKAEMKRNLGTVARIGRAARTPQEPVT